MNSWNFISGPLQVRPLGWLILLVVQVALAGCAKPPEIPQASESTAKQSTSDASSNATNALAEPPVASQHPARESQTASRRSIDSRLVEAYQQLAEYSDTTTMRLTYRFLDGRKESETTVVRTRFANQIACIWRSQASIIESP